MEMDVEVEVSLGLADLTVLPKAQPPQPPDTMTLCSINPIADLTILPNPQPPDTKTLCSLNAIAALVQVGVCVSWIVAVGWCVRLCV